MNNSPEPTTPTDDGKGHQSDNDPRPDTYSVGRYHPSTGILSLPTTSDFTTVNLRPDDIHLGSHHARRSERSSRTPSDDNLMNEDDIKQAMSEITESQPTAPSGEHEDGKSESEESKTRRRQQKNREKLESLLYPNGRADDTKKMNFKLPSPASIRDKRSQRSRRGGSVNSGSSKSYQYPASRQPTTAHTGKTTLMRHAEEGSRVGGREGGTSVE